jgi:alpha-L-fucosidase 2
MKNLVAEGKTIDHTPAAARAAGAATLIGVVGNGRIGAMVFGNPIKERIQFNDASLWTGGANPSGGYDVNEFGAYQNFGDLFIEMNGSGETATVAPRCASGRS